MSGPPITSLEKWVGRKIGLPAGYRLKRRHIDAHQLAALNRTLAQVRDRSPFYRHRFRCLPAGLISKLADLSTLPFTCDADIRRDPLAFLCVSRDRITRAVTLATSGTTGRPKRLFFTAADQASTVDFFHHGMTTLVQPNQRVLILMPGQAPGSVGDLLVRGLARLPAEGVVHGPVHDPAAAIGQALRTKASSLVGIPVQVLAMACHPLGNALAGQIDSVLLSTDYVADALVARIEERWRCRVFKHYGMTEMGLGGAVACAARSGYHFREADLLVEIVDPDSGQPVADGIDGEVVFTTLTREGMPLIRYRTGDMASFMADPCPCGTALKTLGAVRGRIDGMIAVGQAQRLSLGELDEAVFGVGGVLDYRVQIGRRDGIDALCLWIDILPGVAYESTASAVRRAVSAVQAVRKALEDDFLTVDVLMNRGQLEASTGVGKRQLNDCRERTDPV